MHEADRFVFNGTPTQFVATVRDYELLAGYGAFPTSVWEASDRWGGDDRRQVSLFNPVDGAHGHETHFVATVTARPGGQSSTVSVTDYAGGTGDWSLLAEMWEGFKAWLGRDGWIGKAKEPARPGLPNPYDWAFYEIELKKRPVSDVFDEYLELVEGIDDPSTLDPFDKDRRYNNFKSAMSARRRRRG